MRVAELAEHLAIRLHQLKMHRSSFTQCTDWECRGNREQLERLAAEREDQEGAA